MLSGVQTVGTMVSLLVQYAEPYELVLLPRIVLSHSRTHVLLQFLALHSPAHRAFCVLGNVVRARLSYAHLWLRICVCVCFCPRVFMHSHTLMLCCGLCVPWRCAHLVVCSDAIRLLLSDFVFSFCMLALSNKFCFVRFPLVCAQVNRCSPQLTTHGK